MERKKNIVILGASGSIGQQTLDVVRKNSDKLKVAGLVVFSSKDFLKKVASEFCVKQTVVVDECSSKTEAAKQINEIITDPNVDIVVNAISGAAGLEFSYKSLKAEKTVALTNKESLVVGGDIIMPIVKALMQKSNQVKLMPIDSEHGAIFQCLNGEENNQIYKIWITASGGPFFGKTLEELKNVTCKQALNHPTWNMGPKITIDSATLMNKGLEVIEAHHLFGVDKDKINVVVQQQSAIHSMVEYVDGSVKAHLGTTDMRIPIQYTLSYPNRWNTPVKRIDFREINKLNFGYPDTKTFKCLKLAFDAMQIGGTMPCVMNAANEIAVDKFLNNKCSFLDIPNIIEKTMQKAIDKKIIQKVETLEQLKEIDIWSRNNS